MTENPIEIRGMFHDLDNNRKVFVGQTPGDSTVYLKFSSEPPPAKAGGF